MRLLFISAAFPPMRAGESEHAYHQCLHLASQGVEVHLLTSCANLGHPEMPFAVHPIMRDWSWEDLPRLAGFFLKNKPDVEADLQEVADKLQLPKIDIGAGS